MVRKYMNSTFLAIKSHKGKTATLAVFLGLATISFIPMAHAMPKMAGGEAFESTLKTRDLLIKVADTKNADAIDPELYEGAQTFVDNMSQKALAFLGDDATSTEKKREEFRNLLQKSFDMATIGRFSLGRYWRVSTKQQRQEYITLFEDMVIEVYSSRFGEYKGQKFETRSFRPDGKKDTIVTSFIIPESGPEVQVDWRVRYKDGHYKIVDVIVEGVSMSVTQRSDFSAVIQRGGGNIQVLLDHLKKQTNNTL